MTEREKLKVAVYTCNVGNYDIVLPPRVPTGDVPFYCFTDHPQQRVAGWTTRPLVHPPSVTRPDLVNRYHKFFPHRVLPDVNCSVYVDGRIRVFGDILSWIEKLAEYNVALICRRHPKRATIFEEAERCQERGLFNEREKVLIHQQLETYLADGMPSNQALSENNLLIRFHDVPGLNEAMEMWWRHVLDYTRRDQLSLPYILWKTGLPTILTDDINWHVYLRRKELPTVLTDKQKSFPPNPHFVMYGHRQRGMHGLWQRVHLQRNDQWWCDVLCHVECKAHSFRRLLRRLIKK